MQTYTQCANISWKVAPRRQGALRVRARIAHVGKWVWRKYLNFRMWKMCESMFNALEFICARFWCLAAAHENNEADIIMWQMRILAYMNNGAMDRLYFIYIYICDMYIGILMCVVSITVRKTIAKWYFNLFLPIYTIYNIHIRMYIVYTFNSNCIIAGFYGMIFDFALL